MISRLMKLRKLDRFALRLLRSRFLLASRTEAGVTVATFVSFPRKGFSMNDAIHNFAAGLYFEPYAIDQLVDASRHHRLPLDPWVETHS